MLAERERVVAAQGDTVGADQSEQMTQGVGIVDEGVVDEAIEKGAGAGPAVGGAEVGPHRVAVGDASDREGKRAAAVGESDAKLGESVEHAAHRERGRGPRGLGGHAHQPRQPVLRHLRGAHHVPRVHEDRGPEAGRGLEDWKQRGLVEVPRLDVRADLHTTESEVADAAFEFGAREVGSLHRDRAETFEAIRAIADDPREVIVEQPREIEGVRGLRPVAEHDRHGREHLHIHAVVVAVCDPAARAPAAVVDLAERPAVDHHPCPARGAVVERDPAAVAVLLGKVGPSLGQQVGVQIDDGSRHGRIVPAPVTEYDRPPPMRRRAAQRSASLLLVRLACGGAMPMSSAAAQFAEIPISPATPGSDDPLQSAGPPAVAFTAEAPEIDGVLEEVWDAGTRLPDTWRQVLPDEGAAPSQRTDVFLMRDDRNLYVAIRCHDTEPDRIVARGLQRDTGIGADDHVVVLLDPKRDRRTGYTFAMTPRGARYDARIVNGREDSDWDAIWDGRSSIDETGWTAEFVIPFRTISIDPDATEWGFNAQRIIRRNNETDRWAAADRDIAFNSVAEAGVVGMFGDIDQGAGIDVRPYGKFSWEQEDDSSASGTAGVDVFWRVTPSLTFVGTVNPDFAETEVDQRIINFSRFSVRFPERRDFFLEDAGYFNFGGIRSTPAPFYSRRIGLSPQGQPETILGGLKLTGTIGDVSIGVLDTVMGDEVEPAGRNYFAGRALVNVLEQSSIGVVATSGNPLDGRSNQLVGADFNYATNDLAGGRTLTANAWFQQTFTGGDEIDAADASAVGLRFSYPNDVWSVGGGWARIGADYFPALGFANRIGIHEFFGNARRRWRPENELIRSVDVGANGFWVTGLDMATQSLRLDLDVPRVQFERGDTAFLRVGVQQEVPDQDFLAAGTLLVPAGDYLWPTISTGFETTSRDPFEIGGTAGWSGYYGGSRVELAGNARWQPEASFLLSGGLAWNGVELDTGSLETVLASGRVNFYFSPLVSWENLVQYDTQSGTIGVNSRFRWALRDGQEIFIVYNQNVEADDLAFTIARHEIVAKIGWTFSF